jgi:phage tail sheath protein FI
MPITPTYPGVYIEEIPSGVRTIPGVATSVTAFVGRAARGPVNDPVTINSFGDFQRVFGGLSLDSTLSFAVNDFFQHGGSQAIIVRLFRPTDHHEALVAAQAIAKNAKTAAEKVDATPASVQAAAQLTADALTDNESRRSAAKFVMAAINAAAAQSGATAASVNTAAQNAIAGAAPLAKARLRIINSEVNALIDLEAASEGVWGNSLRGRVDYDVKDPHANQQFNLAIKDGTTGATEYIRNLSVQTNDPRRIDRILPSESQLVRVLGALPNDRPGESPLVSPGQDPFGDNTSIGVLEEAKAADSQSLTSLDYLGSQANKQGLFALENVDLFNLLCIPPYSFDADVDALVWAAAASYCEKRRAFLIVDPPAVKNAWVNKDAAKGDGKTTGVEALGTRSDHAAVFFPLLREPNPLLNNQLNPVAPCGAVAGIFARTDSQRGVWKAPAGLDAAFSSVSQLSVTLTDPEIGELNPLGINCLKVAPGAGPVIWGARTLAGADRRTPSALEKYIPVRRLALYLEESLFRGTQWVVFEPNDAALWAQIRLNVGAFMHDLFVRGAFQGTTPQQAYFVRCDSETTTQNDIDRGIVNILVGFAPLKPAEFVIIQIQQIAGQIQT